MAFGIDWGKAKFGDIGKVGIHERDKHRFTPLHDAVQHGSPALVSAMIKAGANVNAKNNRGETPLHKAIWKVTNPKNLSVLLTANVKVDAKDDDGKTPLHLAAIGQSTPKIILTLEQAGACVNALDNDRQTPLHLAAGGTDQQIVQTLLKLGSKPKAKNAMGYTAYDIIQRNRHLKNTAACRKLRGLSI